MLLYLVRCTFIKKEEVKAMPMPTDIFAVRHGESEGNIGHSKNRKNLGHEVPEALYDIPGCDWRLTEKGVEQAKAAGIWFAQAKDIPHLDAGLVSPYIRAVETAAHLGLAPNGSQFWTHDNRLRERDWGEMDRVQSQDEYDAHRHILARCTDGNWQGKPPGGESILQLHDRVALVNGSLARHYPEMCIVLVTHGEFKGALAMSYHHWTMKYAEQLSAERHYLTNPVNCQITQYSHRDPDSGDIRPHISFVRSIVPWDLDHKNNRDWTKVRTKKYCDSDLFDQVENYRHYF